MTYCSTPPVWTLVGTELARGDVFSCTEHVSEMISDDTVYITRWTADYPGHCCHLGSESSLPELSPPESPVCPYCKEEMVRAHLQIDTGATTKWLVVWLCGCRPDSQVLKTVKKLQDKTSEHVIGMLGT